MKLSGKGVLIGLTTWVAISVVGATITNKKNDKWLKENQERCDKEFEEGLNKLDEEEA